jgi:hypothetical protein
VEARIIAPKAGVVVNTEKCGCELRSEKDKKGDVEESAGEDDPFPKNHLNKPGNGDDNCQNIGKHHLVVFKQLKIPRSHYQRNKKKEAVEGVFNYPIANFLPIHELSISHA